MKKTKLIPAIALASALMMGCPSDGPSVPGPDPNPACDTYLCLDMWYNSENTMNNRSAQKCAEASCGNAIAHANSARTVYSGARATSASNRGAPSHVKVRYGDINRSTKTILKNQGPNDLNTWYCYSQADGISGINAGTAWLDNTHGK